MTPDESIWKIFDYAWALVGGLLMLVWNMLNGKINENNKAVHARIKETNAAIESQRVDMSKLFDRLDKHATDSHDRHVELLTAIHVGLAQKQDK